MKKITIEIGDSELMREAAKWSYTIGESIPDEQAKIRHFVQGAADRGHIDLLRAAADSAWSELVQTLSAYTVDGSCGCEGCTEYRCGCGDGQGTDPINAIMGGKQMFGNYTITLFMPDNTYPLIGENIRRLCFRYLTLSIRSEWERLTKQDGDVSAREAEMVIRRLKVEIATRTTRQKLTRYNYGY